MIMIIFIKKMSRAFFEQILHSISVLKVHCFYMDIVENIKKKLLVLDKLNIRI